MTEHRIIQGDVLDGLRALPGNLVQCCVTSPPYWGLRNYGVDGQIGLEKTPEEYVAKMVEVFREVRRVLRDDGVLFLNLGDSYAGSGKGPTGENGIGDQEKRQGFVNLRSNVQRCDTSGKVESDCQDCDYSSGSLYGEHIDFWWSRISDNGARRAHGQSLELCQRIRESKETWLVHPASVGFSDQKQILQFLISMRDQVKILIPAIEQLLAFQESKPAVFVPPPLDGSMPMDMLSAFLLLLRSSISYVQECEHMLVGSSEKQHCTPDISSPFLVLGSHSRCIFGYCSLVASWLKLSHIQPQYTTSDTINIPLKSKDMVGIPWRVAFALQADGWYLRSDIIWAKRNCMPESVTDRPTKAHEYIFLLTKQPRYFYDGDAIREPASESYVNDKRPQGVLRQCVNENSKYPDEGQFKKKPNKQDQTGNPTYTGFNDRWNAKNLQRVEGVHTMHKIRANGGPDAGDGITRNKRTVWWINPQPRPEAHFATFPDELAETCIKAGTSEYGCCPECGAPWERVVEKTFIRQQDVSAEKGIKGAGNQKPMDESNSWEGFPRGSTACKTTGWQPTCTCGKDELGSCVVLDPFMGSGTVAVIARDLNRSSIGIELNPEYVKIIKERLQADSQLDTGVIQYRFEKVSV